MSTNQPPDSPTSPTSGSGNTSSGGTGPGTTGTATASGQQHGAPHGAPPLADFFDKIRSFGLVRPDDGRWAAGVCAAVANRTGVDVVLVRGLFVVLALLGGGGFALYGLGWLFLPHPDGRIHAQEVLRGVVTAGFVGAVLLTFSGLPNWGWNGNNMGWGFHPGGIWLLLGIALVVWVVKSRKDGRPWTGGPGGPGGPNGNGPATGPAPGAGTAPGTGTTPGAGPSTGTPASAPWGTPGAPPRGSGSEGPGGSAGTPWATSATTAPYGSATVVTAPPPPAPDLSRPSHALTRATLGAAVLAGAGVALYDRFAGDVPSVVAVVAAVSLGVVALGVLAAGVTGRRAGGLAPIGVLLAVVAVNAATIGSVNTGAGDLVVRPTSVSQAESGLRHGAGDVRLDLTDPAMRTGATATDPVEMSVSVGAGRLVIVVPANTATRVDAQVGLGEIADRVGTTGTTNGGGRSRELVAGTGAVTVVVHAAVGVGQVVVVKPGDSLALTGPSRTALPGARPALVTTEALR